MPKWEHGQVIRINNVPINTPSTSPLAFCWDIVEIGTDFGIYNGTRYLTETLANDSSSADWFAFKQKSVYAEMHYGSYVTATVHGIPQNEPTVKIGSKIGVLTGVSNVNSPGGILNGKEYRFFIRHIPVSQATTLPDIDINDYIYIYDGSTLKDITFIK